MSKAGYKKGWNISNDNLFEIYSFINNMETNTKVQIRNKAILEYAFIKNMSALQISKINDPRLVSFSNNYTNRPLSHVAISRIINSYNLIHEKKIEYAKNPSYEKRKKFKKLRLSGELKKPKICSCCGKKDNLHLHHIIPMSKGGPDNYYNLIYVCDDCHENIHNLYEEYKNNVFFKEVKND